MFITPDCPLVDWLEVSSDQHVGVELLSEHGAVGELHRKRAEPNVCVLGLSMLMWNHYCAA